MKVFFHAYSCIALSIKKWDILNHAIYSETSIGEPNKHECGCCRLLTLLSSQFSCQWLWQPLYDMHPTWLSLTNELKFVLNIHYNDIIMSAMASQITSLTIVYSTVYSRRRSKETSKLCATGLCAGNSPVTGEFPAQRASDAASNAKNVSIWWRHHGWSCIAKHIMKICMSQSCTIVTCLCANFQDKTLFSTNQNTFCDNDWR